MIYLLCNHKICCDEKCTNVKHIPNGVSDAVCPIKTCCTKGPAFINWNMVDKMEAVIPDETQSCQMCFPSVPHTASSYCVDCEQYAELLASLEAEKVKLHSSFEEVRQLAALCLSCAAAA